ncbi:tRNA methyltransferase [Listeria monocytogenes]|nr:tRNA methyltransferase [Listeria monocytogenes]
MTQTKIISSFLEKKRPDCQMRFYKRMKKIVCVFQ